MRVQRSVIRGFTALGLGALGLAAQSGIALAAPSEPSIQSVSSSAVRQYEARLDGRIDPGEAATTYHFEYGSSNSYGTSVPVPDAEIESGTETVSVGQELSGLQPGSTYHYRLVARNALGNVASADETFTTPPIQPPVVSTGAAAGVAQGSATLTATIDTRGFETVYEFDLGADSSYGSRIFGTAGAEPGPQTFTVPLQSLKPGTTYHYRIRATNTFGTSYGVDETFTTAIYPSAILSAPAVPALLATPLLAPVNANATSAAAKSARVARAARAGRLGARRRASASKHARGQASRRSRSRSDRRNRHEGRSAERAGRVGDAGRGGNR